MDTNITTRPGVSPVSLAPVSGMASVLPGLEMGAIGLAAASELLHMRVADLGGLLTAHAEADLVQCPVCRTHPRRAA